MDGPLRGTTGGSPRDTAPALRGAVDAGDRGGCSMKRIAIITKAICQSRKFETGEGTCAFICMGELGDARAKGCPHHPRVHHDLAEKIDAALSKAEGDAP